jgi:ammonium transporter
VRSCWLLAGLLALSTFVASPSPASAQAPAPESKQDTLAKKIQDLEAKANAAEVKGDSAWLLMSSALVLLMVPGLALFYGGMVRRKNVLATMMHSMACLAFVGVFWIVIGYSLAFGDPWLKIGGASILGFSKELILLQGVRPDSMLPNGTIPVYLHMLFQGMFAIITPALISGAIAERIRFRTYLVFVLIWIVLVYCPLAHCVWAQDYNWTYSLLPTDEKAAKDLKLPTQQQYVEGKLKGVSDPKEQEKITKGFEESGKHPVGLLGGSKDIGGLEALDFAGGTVVHIAAGLSSLGVILVLRRRKGYPEHSFHPNSMVLTLSGAGLLWFGWFGFNGGSALASGSLATVAFAASQAAAAGAALSWTLVEWIHRGKPTALGLASGLVAGLVAVTPASGYVLPGAGLLIGLIAGVVCYVSVYCKTIFKYDDSLDAFGVHGVGGFLGAVLTGVFVSKLVDTNYPDAGGSQAWQQFLAAAITAALGFTVSAIAAKVLDIVMGFTTDDEDEVTGLDRTEHGEVGFDLGLALESVGGPVSMEPRPAIKPPNGVTHFGIVVEGIPETTLMKAWSELCQPNKAVPVEFKNVYPYLTTVQGNRFNFRGGDQQMMSDSLKRLFETRLKQPVRTKVEG